MQVPVVLHVVQDGSCGGESVEGFPLSLAQVGGEHVDEVVVEAGEVGPC